MLHTPIPTLPAFLLFSLSIMDSRDSTSGSLSQIFTAKCNRQLWSTILENAPGFDTSKKRRKCPLCALQIHF